VFISSDLLYVQVSDFILVHFSIVCIIFMCTLCILLTPLLISHFCPVKIICYLFYITNSIEIIPWEADCH
jgi:hypothetical protein